tara:strand:- start:95 stop:862 length:768 start_codon:yes stop_codon:yes gene_type:complete
MPFETHYTDATTEVKKRLKFFELADFLLTHNENSKEDLINLYNINSDKIIYHNFPVMDLSHIRDIAAIENDLISESKKKILFVGHARKEKGLDLLLDAWELGVPQNLHMTVACNVPVGAKFKFDDIKGKNFTLIDRFLTDSEYASLIRQHDFVFLPYLKGTNSGIPGSTISLGSIPVCSDIAMFRNNELLDQGFLFKSGDVADLARCLNDISLLSVEDINEMNAGYKSRLASYRHDFSRNINSLYEIVIRKSKIN